MTDSSIPRPRPENPHRPIRSTSLRALAVAARLERARNEGPPGSTSAKPARAPQMA